MKAQFSTIALSAIAACAVFLILFRIRKVQKAFLKVKYDHYIDGTVLEAGTYIGYIIQAYEKPYQDVVVQGTAWSGSYPQADVRIEPGFVLESRFAKS